MTTAPIEGNRLQLPALTRAATAGEATVDAEKRTIEFSFSSEAPVERWFGDEVLSHKKGAADLARLNDGGALLFNHDTDQLIGVVEKAWIDGGRGMARVRFANTPKADEFLGMVSDGILRNVSFGYRIHEMVESIKDGKSTFTATRWEPYEVSFVSVPADATVGVGRADDTEKRDVILTRAEPAPLAPTQKETTMPERTAAEITAAAADAVTAERARISGITNLGKRFQNEDLARTLIEGGKTMDEARQAFLEAIGEKQVPLTGREAEIGLTPKEAKRYSFLRALNALANPNIRAFQEAAAFERECSEAAAGVTGKAARGLIVPQDVMGNFSRDLLVGTATAGGHAVATELRAQDFITLLRNAMAINGLGARMLSGLVGNIAIPRMTGGATAYWVAENGAPTESQQAFDQVTLAPKTVGAFTDISRKLLIQSSIDVEALVRQDLATVLAIAIDLAAINGSGASNQPRGVINTSGIGSVAGGTNGAQPTFSNMVDLETAVANANADIGNMAYLTNAKIRGRLKQTQRFSGTDGVGVWSEQNQVNGYKAVASNQVPATLTKGTASGICSAIVFGNWADLLVGMWGGLDLTVDPYTGSTAGTVRVVALQDVDVAVRHPESFAAMLDALQ
jgi:HK97 family phage major capsid protein/HK97 family phage prohead protease